MNDKYLRLVEYIKTSAAGHKGVCVAFSGGIDSMLVLRAARDTGLPVLALTFSHQLLPHGEDMDARDYAASLSAEHIVINADALEPEEVRFNRTDRCYVCKKRLFSSIKAIADERGFLAADGTNSDDLNVYRPGRRALEELGILSPLARCSFSKSMVRDTARELGIAFHTKPSGSCYATRFPYNTELTDAKIKMVREAEGYMQSLGFSQVRVRTHFDVNGSPIARIEVERGEFDMFFKLIGDIADTLTSMGFTYVTLDTQGWRSGSMDNILN